MRSRLLAVVVIGVVACYEAPSPAPPEQPFTVSVEALGCYGICPQYTLHIDGRGTATLDAKRHMPFVGRAHATVDVRSVRAILQRHRFFTLSCVRQADEDTMIVEVADGSMVKRLSCSASPLRDEPFARLVQDIHTLVAARQWVRQ